MLVTQFWDVNHKVDMCRAGKPIGPSSCCVILYKFFRWTQQLQNGHHHCSLKRVFEVILKSKDPIWENAFVEAQLELTMFKLYTEMHKNVDLLRKTQRDQGIISNLRNLAVSRCFPRISVQGRIRPRRSRSICVSLQTISDSSGLPRENREFFLFALGAILFVPPARVLPSFSERLGRSLDRRSMTPEDKHK